MTSAAAGAVDPAELARGSWHIVRSTLPMWRKRAGVITYAPLPDGAVADMVTVQRGDRISRIVGIDRPIAQDGWHFEWRGVQPLTLLVRSRWCFVAADPAAGWAVTLFERTIFSAAGIDVYCRSPDIDAAALKAATAAGLADPRTAPFMAALFAPPRWHVPAAASARPAR